MSSQSVKLHLPGLHPRSSSGADSLLTLLAWTVFTILVVGLFVWAMASQLRAPAPVESTELRPVSEIGAILVQRGALKLAGAQVEALSKLDFQWLVERNRLEAKLARSVASAHELTRSVKGERNVSVGTIIAAGSSYDSVAEELGERRLYFLSQAYSLLTPEQKTLLDRIPAR